MKNLKKVMKLHQICSPRYHRDRYSENNKTNQWNCTIQETHSTTSTSAHVFPIRGRRERGLGKLQTRH